MESRLPRNLVNEEEEKFFCSLGQRDVCRLQEMPARAGSFFSLFSHRLAPGMGVWRQRWWLRGFWASAGAARWSCCQQAPLSLGLHGRIPGLCINLRCCGFWNTVSFHGFPFLPLWLMSCHCCVQLEVSVPACSNCSSGDRQLLMSPQSSCPTNWFL